MRGHTFRRDGKTGPRWGFVVDVGTQQARRCTACRRRVWVRDYREDTCPKCTAPLGEARRERRQRTETFKSAKRRDKELAAAVSALDRGENPFPRDITLGSYLEDWLERRLSSLRPKTIHRYRHFIRRWFIPELGEILLDQVRVGDVQAVIDAMSGSGLKPRTVRQARAVLRVAFADALRGELVSRNPVDAVRGPKVGDPGLHVLRPEEVLAALRAAREGSWAVPIVLAGTTAGRRSEVLAVRWSDIDLDAGRLSFRRTLQDHPETGALEFYDNKTERSKRTIRLTPSTVVVLRAHKVEQAERRLTLGPGWQDLDLVCERGDGAPLHPDSFTKATKKILREIGAPKARLHDLRHGVAVLLALEGVPLEAISAILGHASAGFTLSVYRHMVDEMGEQAADALERRLGDAPDAGVLAKR